MKHSWMMSWLLGVVFLLAWEGWVVVNQTSPLVLPAPSVVVVSLLQGLSSGYLWPHILSTLSAVLMGFLLGSAMGFLGGLLLGELTGLRGVVMPFVVASQVIPKLALAPLFIVWFGFGSLPIIVMTALICFFPLLENTAAAIRQTDSKQLELFRMLRASRWQTLWHLKVPAGRVTIYAGLRVAVVLAWVGAVVAEFIVASKGLGALIIAAQGSMDTPLMFAVLTLITVLGLCFYKSTQWLTRT
ncbi:MAG: ABC transporter permease [Burkholderiaceae bacterium]